MYNFVNKSLHEKRQVHLFMQEHEKRKPWRVIIPSKYQLTMIYTQNVDYHYLIEMKAFCYHIISV